MAHEKQIYEEKGLRERCHFLILLAHYASQRKQRKCSKRLAWASNKFYLKPKKEFQVRLLRVSRKEQH